MESGHFLRRARPPTWAFTTTEHAYFIPIQSHLFLPRMCTRREAERRVKRADVLLIFKERKTQKLRLSQALRKDTPQWLCGSPQWAKGLDKHATATLGQDHIHPPWPPLCPFWRHRDKESFLWSEWAVHLGCPDNCPGLWEAELPLLLMSDPVVSRHHPHTGHGLYLRGFLCPDLCRP